jgi:hypothetical protein
MRRNKWIQKGNGKTYIYTETCQEILGKNTTQRNERITPRTSLKVKERKQKKEEFNNAKTRQRKVTI